ncbi:MAG: porin family protein [Treponema sp.]|jgi:hypothetical protein|nr:porin family protein [Treponema sp.]
MKKLFCVLLVFMVTTSAFAQKITATGKPPIVKGGPEADALNTAIKTAFGDVMTELNDQLGDIKFSNPKKLLQAMGNSSAYASHGATTRGYGGYKLFSASVGPMFGLQLPTGISSLFDDIDALENSMSKDGDINLGLNPNALNFNVGLNLGIFTLDHWYVGLRVGYFNLPDLFEGLSFNTFTLGATVNYQILPSLSLVGLVTWRGLSLGSGILYSSSDISFTVPLGSDIDEPFTSGSVNGNIHMSPEASLSLSTYTVTIPLEAITAIKLLIFNIPLGIGADLSFGKTSLGFGVDSDIKLTGLPTGYKATGGSISVKGEASNSPSFFNFKIMTGFGFAFGPVILDIPLTFYPASGYNLGLTIGVVF